MGFSDPAVYELGCESWSRIYMGLVFFIFVLSCFGFGWNEIGEGERNEDLTEESEHTQAIV